jgi:hypothetical protein
VRDRTPPAVPGEDGLLALELAQEIKAALKRQLLLFREGEEPGELAELFPEEVLTFLQSETGG